MSQERRLLADTLFAIQISGALVVCGSQFVRLLETTEGQLISKFILSEAYLLLHIMLATSAHRAQSSTVTTQTLWIYSAWTGGFALDIVAILCNGDYEWSHNDTTAFGIAFSGVATALFVKWCGIGWHDPILKSIIVIFVQVAPHFLIAAEVAREGGAGIPVWAIIAGNITISVRVVHVWLSVREARWDRNRVCMCINETMNEISWLTVSLTWLLVPERGFA